MKIDPELTRLLSPRLVGRGTDLNTCISTYVIECRFDDMLILDYLHAKGFQLSESMLIRQIGFMLGAVEVREWRDERERARVAVYTIERPMVEAFTLDRASVETAEFEEVDPRALEARQDLADPNIGLLAPSRS